MSCEASCIAEKYLFSFNDTTATWDSCCSPVTMQCPGEMYYYQSVFNCEAECTVSNNNVSVDCSMPLSYSPQLCHGEEQMVCLNVTTCDMVTSGSTQYQMVGLNLTGSCTLPSAAAAVDHFAVSSALLYEYSTPACMVGVVLLLCCAFWVYFTALVLQRSPVMSWSTYTLCYWCFNINNSSDGDGGKPSQEVRGEVESKRYLKTSASESTSELALLHVQLKWCVIVFTLCLMDVVVLSYRLGYLNLYSKGSDAYVAHRVNGQLTYFNSYLPTALVEGGYDTEPCVYNDEAQPVDSVCGNFWLPFSPPLTNSGVLEGLAVVFFVVNLFRSFTWLYILQYSYGGDFIFAVVIEVVVNFQTVFLLFPATVVWPNAFCLEFQSPFDPELSLCLFRIANEFFMWHCWVWLLSVLLLQFLHEKLTEIDTKKQLTALQKAGAVLGVIVLIPVALVTSCSGLFAFAGSPFLGAYYLFYGLSQGWESCTYLGYRLLVFSVLLPVAVAFDRYLLVRDSDIVTMSSLTAARKEFNDANDATNHEESISASGVVVEMSEVCNPMASIATPRVH
jgi:hypothetical protein